MRLSWSPFFIPFSTINSSQTKGYKMGSDSVGECIVSAPEIVHDPKHGPFKASKLSERSTAGLAAFPRRADVTFRGSG